MKSSRSLSACEGALLVVDASQGVEAQTVANCYTALDLGVEVVPVLNKIDLPHADPANATSRDRGRDRHRRRATRSSARPRAAWAWKTCWNRMIATVPPPKGDPDAPLQALIVDSWFDNYVGVVMLVRVVNGTLQAERKDPADGDRFDAAGREASACSRPRRCSLPSSCRPAQVGFVIAGIKELKAAKVGDTVTLAAQARAPSRCRASRKSSRRCSPACSRSKRTSTTRCATRWKSSS